MTGGDSSSEDSSLTGGDSSSEDSSSTGGDSSSETPVITTYSVTFDSNGGSAVATQTVEENATVTEPENPTKANYTFDGWLLNGEVYDFFTPITTDIELKASWKAKTYTVTFEGVDGVEPITATYDQVLTNLPTLPEKTGYNGDWKIGEDVITNETVWNYTEDKTVTAVYTAKTYTVTFEGVDGVEPITATYDQVLTNLPTLPEKTGYNGDWKIGEDVITNETVWNYTEDKTVTAVYTAKTYTVTFEGVDGVEPITATYGEEYTLAVPPASDAFASFVGWMYEEELLTSEKWDIDAENIVLKAKWTYAQSFENGIPEGFVIKGQNTTASQSNTQASDGSYSMLLHTTSSNGYGYTVLSKDYLDKVFANPNVIGLSMDVYSNKTFADFRYRGLKADGSEGNIVYDGVGLTENTWKTIVYPRKAYENYTKLATDPYILYYSPSAAGLDLYVDNMRPVTAEDFTISFAEGGEISGSDYKVKDETLVSVSGGVNNLMVYEGESSDGDGKSLRHRFWRNNPGGDIVLPMETMRAAAGAYSYIAFDVKVAYDVSGAFYYTKSSGTGTYADIKAGEWTTLYCPINIYDLQYMKTSYIFRLPACSDYDDFFVFIDNIRFVNEIPA